MNDLEVERDHDAKKVIICEADVDIGIIPLVKWMNSLNGIITRWSCEGNDETGIFPYVVFFTEPYNEFELVEKIANTSNGVGIDPLCTEGKIHEYNLVLLSTSDMQNFQSKVSVLAAGESDDNHPEIS